MLTEWRPKSRLANLVYAAGFAYDPGQDILYSRMYPWQRLAGFTWAYDEAGPLMLMILDCETFYFTYQGKQWLIELWKGQYGIETGAEIGVYNRLDPMSHVDSGHKAATDGALDPTQVALGGPGGARDLQERFRARTRNRSAFFDSANNADMLRMSFTLKRDGTKLLHRGTETHWWLTGFRWGEYTEKIDSLAMEVFIAFRDREMCDQFKLAATALGYGPFPPGSSSVAFTFRAPRTPQPRSRTKMEGNIQKINKKLVHQYRNLKEALELSSNDPNGFGLPIESWVKETGKKIGHNIDAKISQKSEKAQTLRNKAASVAKKAERNIEDKLASISDDTMDGYREITEIFEKKKWRCRL
jgi:hypothetical protein